MCVRVVVLGVFCSFFFKNRTAYDVRISDWSSDVCSSDLANTIVATASLVPEIRLQLATEVTPLWQASERLLRDAHLPPPFWAFAWPGGQAVARYGIGRAPCRERLAQYLSFSMVT